MTQEIANAPEYIDDSVTVSFKDALGPGNENTLIVVHESGDIGEVMTLTGSVRAKYYRQGGVERTCDNLEGAIAWLCDCLQGAN